MSTSRKIKAKVLDYKIFYHGFFYGKAKIELLEGEDKGKTITIQTVEHYKKNDVITVYASA
jgi:hypothetical protein